MPTYKFRSGMTFGGVGAEVAVAELNGIHERNGKVTPERVVEEARSGNSPLHSVFEWDDAKAGEQHRLQQARSFIRALIVVPDGSAQGGNAFVHVTIASEPQYQPISVVVRDHDMFRVALQEFQTKLDTASRSLADLLAAYDTYRAT